MTTEEKVKLIEAILRTDIRQNSQNYRQLYIQVFGKPWSGCSCNMSTLKESLRTFYNNNKVITL